MLFHSLDKIISSNANVKLLPHLKAYISALNTQRTIISERYQETPGNESPLILLFKTILDSVDILELLKKTSDTDAYFDTLLNSIPQLTSVFDSVQTGVKYANLIVRHSGAEYIISVQNQDPVSNLPFDQGWSEWQHVKAFRLLELNSLELTFKTGQDQIVFSPNTIPSKVVASLDVVALILQYVNFIKEVSPTINQVTYCHRYVLDSVIEDLQNNWLINLYETFLNAANVEPNKTINHYYNLVPDSGFYGYSNASYRSAVDDIVTLIYQCRNRSVSPQTLFQSLLLSDKSLKNHVIDIQTSISIPNERQYYWVEYIRDRRWIRLLYLIYNIQPTNTESVDFTRSLRRDCPIIIGQRIWHNCHDVNTAIMIEKDLKELLELCNAK